MRSHWIAVAVACALASARPASADSTCPTPLARDQVRACALSHSLSLKSEAFAVRALVGRRRAALPIVPTNPVLAVTVSRRTATGTPEVAVDWDVQLSQELEIGGQRGLRLDAAARGIQAEQQREVALRRAVVADALVAYFDVLGAHDVLDLSRRLETVAGDVSRATQGMAGQGLASGVDADVAEAAAFRATQNRVEAEGALSAARVTLTATVGLDPASPLDATGVLAPLPDVAQRARAALGLERPDVRAYELDALAWSARAATFRRSRVPNVTLSAFVEKDAFDEQVFGFGLAVPIPFPQPVGRAFDGEAAEADALGAQSRVDAARARVDLRAGVFRALADLEAKVAARDVIPEDRLDRAAVSLRSIASQVTAGRMAIRDAVVAEQSLVDMLLAAARARLAVCVASVELARAASLPLERGAP